MTVEVADPSVEQICELLRQLDVIRGRRQLRGGQGEPPRSRLDALNGIAIGARPRQQPELLGGLLEGQWPQIQGTDARGPPSP